MAKALDIISVARSNNLIENIKKGGETVYSFCQRTNEDYPSINKYINKTLKIGDKVARRLEVLLNLNNGDLDDGLPDEQFAKLPIIDMLSHNEFNLNNAMKNAESCVLLQNSIISSFGWNRDALAIIIAKDDSMEPTIQESAKAIVDISQAEHIQLNKIYAIKIFGDIYLRRITKSLSTGNLILTPDSVTFNHNNKYKVEELIHDNYEIIGRVVMLRDAFI